MKDVRAISGAGAKAILEIRFYRKEDRAAVRRICADTGFLGNPVDPLFEDRELFADYLTRYHTDCEPESTLVCESGGRVVGYLMGCRRPRAKALWDLRYNPALVLRGLWHYFFRPYNAASRRYVRWVVAHGRRQTPRAPRGMPYFHINLLPEARSVAATRALIDRFLDYLATCGEKAVYGQMVTFESRRGERMFARYGFSIIDRAEVTKYAHLTSERVFLFTVVKDLARHGRLYGGGLG